MSRQRVGQCVVRPPSVQQEEETVPDRHQGAYAELRDTSTCRCREAGSPPLLDACSGCRSETLLSHSKYYPRSRIVALRICLFSLAHRKHVRLRLETITGGMDAGLTFTLADHSSHHAERKQRALLQFEIASRFIENTAAADMQKILEVRAARRRPC